jgi:signal transduction histidine kinase/CheY-like chemotaxis protein
MLHETALQWLNDFSAQGILVTDAQLVIREWGRWLETHSEHNAAEMVGRPLFEAYPELITRGLDRYYQDALQGQVRVLAHRFHHYLLPLRAVSGEPGAFAQMQQSARIAPLIEDGQVIGTITIIEDVTERVAREERLIQLLTREQSLRAEAEAANRAKDEFLATVSHELRTPLNAMYGWMQVLQRLDYERDSVIRGMEAIDRNIKAQLRLIDDILDVSRIVTGKFSLDVRPVNLVSVIEGALDAVRPAADAKTIELLVNLDAAAGQVSGDAQRLQQVVWNLLANAIKFTPKSGHVAIELKRADSQIEIAVSDTGQGISAEFLPFVFDRFRQADSSSARQHGGLGLGLAIVRHLVELHGGTAQALSDGEGQGATFVIRLPLLALRKPAPRPMGNWASGAGSSASPDQANSDGDRDGSRIVQLSGIRVLVVDDETDARDTLKLILNECGAEVQTAASAKAALETIKAWRPDVLVSDIGLPQEDGYALIEQVRALEPQSGWNTPAVALTGYARSMDRDQLLAAGYQRYFSKPVEIRELASAIVSLAGRSAPEAQSSAEPS